LFRLGPVSAKNRLPSKLVWSCPVQNQCRGNARQSCTKRLGPGWSPEKISRGDWAWATSYGQPRPVSQFFNRAGRLQWSFPVFPEFPGVLVPGPKRPGGNRKPNRAFSNNGPLLKCQLPNTWPSHWCKFFRRFHFFCFNPSFQSFPKKNKVSSISRETGVCCGLRRARACRVFAT